MKENRTSTRLEICLSTKLQGSSSTQNTRISDLSKGGCYIDTIADVIVGETLHFKILMPNGEWFELTGIVAHHTSRMGFGVQFVELDEQQIRNINCLLGLPDTSPVESSESPEYPPAPIPWEQLDFSVGSVM